MSIKEICQHEYQYSWIYDSWMCIHCDKLKNSID